MLFAFQLQSFVLGCTRHNIAEDEVDRENGTACLTSFVVFYGIRWETRCLAMLSKPSFTAVLRHVVSSLARYGLATSTYTFGRSNEGKKSERDKRRVDGTLAEVLTLHATQAPFTDEADTLVFITDTR